ncbi:MAG: hypothetical protein VB031_07575 [Eubacteriaceae bacterium]|nr:hypothetical protein [Eubacteriaceae bacterium]
MINYDYLEWGTNVDPEEAMKKIDYKELDEMNFFETGAENVAVDEKPKENDEYNVWFFENTSDQPWGDGNREERRTDIDAQIKEFVKEVKPGHVDWEWRGGYFIDAFLLEDVKGIEDSEYDSVLLLAPDPQDAYPLAIIWEMVPEDKRAPLMNMQRCGCKIYAAFSDHFKFPDENFVCIEIYLKK